ncbi:hypothetical protein NQZ68_032520 [Dissostichus eleginoides]|nr:hypothetical protein NQZ68_032520 [Dissostichus eleginoides]
MNRSSTQFHPHIKHIAQIYKTTLLPGDYFQPELEHISIPYGTILNTHIHKGNSLFLSPDNMCSLNDSNSVDAGDVARNESLARLEIALLSVIFISAAILNTSLLLVLWRQRKQMSRMRIFVFHLCLADLVVAFFQVCPQLIWDITDRYQAVCNPMVKFQRTSTKLNIPVCLAWGVSLLGSLPQVFIFAQVEVAPGVFDCWADFIQPWGLQTYITWITLVIFILPVITLVVCQVRICRVIQINLYQKTQQQRNVGLPLPSRASGVAGMSKARVKTLKMTVAIVLAYIVCWAPFFTVQLWSAWDAHAPKETATFTILMLLASLNSCANPCIYLMFSGHLPKRLMRLLCHRQSDGRDSIHEATLVSTLYMNFKNVSELK